MTIKTKIKDWKQLTKELEQHEREVEKRYCNGLPRKPLSDGRVLVHNHVAHGKHWGSGTNGFRFWTQKAEPSRLVLCKCGWQGVMHYRRKGTGISAYKCIEDWSQKLKDRVFAAH